MADLVGAMTCAMDDVMMGGEGSPVGADLAAAMAGAWPAGSPSPLLSW